MPEQKIILTIDDNGAMTGKTYGFKGETCIEALDELFDLAGNITSVKKTDEFSQQQVVAQKRKLTMKAGS